MGWEIGIRHLGVIMGGAGDFKVGYKQAIISRGLLNIVKFAVWLSHL